MGIDHVKYLREDGKAIQPTLSFRGDYFLEHSRER